MVQIFRNFLNKEECEKLSDIAFQGVKEGWVGPGANSPGEYHYKKRMTSRPYMNDARYPNYVIEISDKIRNFMGLENHPLILKYKNFQHGSDGVVVSVTYPGGNVTEHRDLRSDEGWVTYRCNVMTQAAESGGILYVDGKAIDINVGDLHCYYPSEQVHSVTDVEGNTPRVLWMFGAHRPPEDYFS